MKSVRFRKYEGAGNDFILVDNRDEVFPYQEVAALCHRQKGIGADGVILWERSLTADVRMRIFNSDGSEAEMCGNGARCFFRFLKDLGHEGTQIRVETAERVIALEASGVDVAVSMGDPSDERWGLVVNTDGAQIALDYLNTGVPHAVCFVDDIQEVAVDRLGPILRHHPLFGPKGANVNWVKLGSPLVLRTFERGVEGETLACGTGATAAALVAAKKYRLASPVTLVVASGDRLVVRFTEKTSGFSDVWLAGPARFVYEGLVKILETSESQEGRQLACESH